jgi:hypothetical protein
MIACTGDWTGGWDCSNRGDVDKFITADLKKGRLVEVIDREEPALLLCHWTGIYFNGEEVGFKIFQQVVARLNKRYDNLHWMKLSELARYWAAKELTRIDRRDDVVRLQAPFAVPQFTLKINAKADDVPKLTTGEKPTPLTEVKRLKDLKPSTWLRGKDGVVVCFDLAKGASAIVCKS